MKKLIIAILLASSTQYAYADNKSKSELNQTNSIEISTQDAKKALIKKDHIFIDVREKWEYDNGHIKGIKLIPLSKIPTESLKLDKKAKYIAVCGVGVRSKKAAEKMKKLGLNVVSMAGGMNEWQEKGYPVKKD